MAQDHPDHSLPRTAGGRLLPLGDAAWTVEFGTAIAPSLHGRVLGFARQVEALAARGGLPAVEVVPTFRSVTIHFDPLATDGEALAARLSALAREAQAQAVDGRHWLLPVCFDEAFSPDLPALAAARGLTPEAVPGLLTGACFRVYLIGFMPGFPYMGGLPEALHMPRRATPRTRVPARSLAVAGGMCAVYPWESPGGWHLLGRTPVPLFDPAAAAPALLAAGDRVRLRAVCRDEFVELEARVAAGGFDRHCLRGEPGRG